MMTQRRTLSSDLAALHLLMLGLSLRLPPGEISLIHLQFFQGLLEDCSSSMSLQEDVWYQMHSTQPCSYNVLTSASSIILKSR